MYSPKLNSDLNEIGYTIRATSSEVTGKRKKKN